MLRFVETLINFKNIALATKWRILSISVRNFNFPFFVSDHSHPCETICIFTDRFLVPGIQLGYVHRNIILPASCCSVWLLKLTMNYKNLKKRLILMKLKYQLIISFIMCYDRDGSLKDYRWWKHAKTTAQHILVSNMALKRNTIIWIGSKIFSAQRKELQSHMQQELVFSVSNKYQDVLI